MMRFREGAHIVRHGAPAFLWVIASLGSAYRRDDGALVVPIGNPER